MWTIWERGEGFSKWVTRLNFCLVWMYREPQEWTTGVQGSHWQFCVNKGLGNKGSVNPVVARGGSLFRRGLAFLRFCCSYDLWFSLFCVHIPTKLLQAKHRPKSQVETKSLNLMLLFPPSIPLTSPPMSLTSLPLCICLHQLFSEPLIFFSQFSFPFGVCQSAYFHVSSHCLSIQTFVECLTGLHR